MLIYLKIKYTPESFLKRMKLIFPVFFKFLNFYWKEMCV